jgi:hypothetical protein
MTIIIGYFILAYIDYDVCRERLLSHHYLQITTGVVHDETVREQSCLLRPIYLRSVGKFTFEL